MLIIDQAVNGNGSSYWSYHEFCASIVECAATTIQTCKLESCRGAWRAGLMRRVAIRKPKGRQILRLISARLYTPVPRVCNCGISIIHNQALTSQRCIRACSDDHEVDGGASDVGYRDCVCSVCEKWRPVPLESRRWGWIRVVGVVGIIAIDRDKDILGVNDRWGVPDE